MTQQLFWLIVSGLSLAAVIWIEVKTDKEVAGCLQMVLLVWFATSAMCYARTLPDGMHPQVAQEQTQ